MTPEQGERIYAAIRECKWFSFEAALELLNALDADAARLATVEQANAALRFDLNEAMEEGRKSEADNQRLRDALNAVEWSGNDDGWSVCPCCNYIENEGHDTACLIGAALGAGQEPVK